MKRTLALLLVLIGAVLLLIALGTGIFLKWGQAPVPETLPDELAGRALTRRLDGQGALDEIANLHGQGFTLTSGSVGVFGDRDEVILWVAGTPSVSLAGRLVEDMETRIAEGKSPFSPIGVRQIGERPVYELTGMGQKHFYFQSGQRVVWLAVDHGLGEQALMEAMDFYP
jgi:hypothetical protein